VAKNPNEAGTHKRELVHAAFRAKNTLMTGPICPTRLVKAALASHCAFAALSSGAGHAADQSNTQQASAPVLPSLSNAGWYVRFGALGVLNQSSSNLYSQSVATVFAPGIGAVPFAGVGPQLQLDGRGASYSNTYSVAFTGGYFFAPNWSVEVASGIPMWSSVTINGSSPPGPPSGTVLAKVLPVATPITGLYHFTQFGGFQPYLGAGIAPTFALAVRDGYNTGASYQPALGFVVQGGFDFMLNQHWGVFFDAKQGFAQPTGSATGVNLGQPPGIIPLVSSIKTKARPVLFSTGLTYRF
jgi:outer membrane protein